MKFLCDQMLVRLGRWLRAAGYDTGIITESMPDTDILKKALSEDRLLLTRDRQFKEMADAKGHVIWLSANTIEECARELSGKVHINWLLSPFTRCLLCNRLLSNPPEEAIEQIPDDVKSHSNQYRYCAACGKVYWEGSHTSRMLKKMQDWQHKGKRIHE